jgi:Zn-dependent peptidase ImmA (M78 family)/transcriptional regulator with XRE-family HTH domain
MTTVGDMLRLARQRLGFTQKAAATKIGVAQPVLSRFENGPAEPDELFLNKAASVYDLPREFFDLRDPVYGPPVSVHPMLRAKADISARDLDMVVSEMNLRVMHVRRFLDAVEYSPTNQLPSLAVEDYGSPAKIAGIVRAHWSLPSGPVKNLTGLVERAGVIVGTSDFSGASISGMTFRVPGQPPLVLLNRNHPADRMRFTLAHELGHLVMHRFPTPDMEDEANAFASALLLPEREMREAFAGRRITLELLAALKPEWRVAMQALLMRAKALGYLSDNQSRYLWQQISSRGWRMREPSELDFAHERPTVLNAIIKAHLSDLGYTITELTRLVPLHESEFSKMYDLADDVPSKPRLRLVI